MRTYTTRDGDMLDLIAYRHYDGRQAGAVEQILEANQKLDLSSYDPHLPRGLTIVLPDLPAETDTTVLVRLWD